MPRSYWVTACVTPFHKWRMPIDPNLLQSETSQRNATANMLDGVQSAVREFPWRLDPGIPYVLLVPKYITRTYEDHEKNAEIGPLVIGLEHHLLTPELFRTRPRGFGGEDADPHLVGWVWPATALRPMCSFCVDASVSSARVLDGGEFQQKPLHPGQLVHLCRPHELAILRKFSLRDA